MTTPRRRPLSRRALLAAPLASLSAACVSTRGARLPEDAPAPDFALTSHLGGVVRLSELTARGPAVVVFYRGHW